MGRLSLAALGLAVALTARGAEAQMVHPPENEEPAFKALVTDLERMVEVQQAGGWRIDRYELEDMIPAALQTVCKVPKETRARALVWYDRRIALLGGPVEAAYAKTKDLSPLKPLLFVTRVRMLLVETDRRALTECPFWLDPDRNFQGIQSDRNRFTLNLETGGLIQLRKTEGRWTYGGGGVIRGLVGRGFEHTSILFGAEFAGGAMIKVGGGGTFVINYFPALPFVLRMHDRTYHYDVEIAPMALFQGDDTRFSWGMRFGIGGGVQSRRTRGLIPWAGIAFAYETYFPGARPQMSFLRGGLRVGIVWN
jgi:hypothetical protein